MLIKNKGKKEQKINKYEVRIKQMKVKNQGFEEAMKELIVEKQKNESLKESFLSQMEELKMSLS